MSKMKFRHLPSAHWSGEQGAAASEYAILLAFISAAIAIAVSQFDLTGVFPAIVGKIAALIN